MSAWSKVRPKLGWHVPRNAFLAVCTTYVIHRHLGELIICKGASMEPTILDGDIVIAERLSQKWRTVRRGDIVCVWNPFNSWELWCKRIVHEPLDKIEYDQYYDEPLRRVPPGHYFVVGDNEPVSCDSRTVGPIPMGLLEVRLVARIWPPSRVGWLSTHWFNETGTDL